MDKQIAREVRYHLKDILIEHDIAKFREFCRDQANYSPVAEMDDERVSGLMHTIKATRLYFGDEWQKSRNQLRLEKLEASVEKWSESLNKYLEEEKHFPLCNECTWFREAHAEIKRPCMHLGAAPLDVACFGWSKLNKI